MMSVTAAAFFRRLEAAADQALGAATAIDDLNLRVGNHLIRVSCSSLLLRDKLRRPLAHLQVGGLTTQPAVTLLWLDCRQGDLVMPELPWKPQRFSLEQATAEYSDGPYLFTQHGDAVLTALDNSRSKSIVYVRDARDWPLDHYKQAIFITLYQHLRHLGLHLIHASAVGRDGHVALIAGSAGAGKTTTMLSCMRVGFEFLGDDTTLLRRGPGGGTEVVSLLNTINVTHQTLDWFSELLPHRSAQTNAKGKWLVMVEDVYPGQVAHSGQVAVILVPVITGQPQTTWEPASTLSLLNDMLPYSLDLHSADAARIQLDFLADLLETTPSYRLLLGQDRDRLPALLENLILSGGR